MKPFTAVMANGRTCKAIRIPDPIEEHHLHAIAEFTNRHATIEYDRLKLHTRTGAVVSLYQPGYYLVNIGGTPRVFAPKHFFARFNIVETEE